MCFAACYSCPENARSSAATATCFCANDFYSIKDSGVFGFNCSKCPQNGNCQGGELMNSEDYWIYQGDIKSVSDSDKHFQQAVRILVRRHFHQSYSVA